MNRLFFCDIDGTIVDESRQMYKVSLETRYAFKELQRQGDLVFIASGRNHFLLGEDILSLHADGYVLCNGSYVLINDRCIYAQAFSSEEIQAIDDTVCRHRGFCFMESADMAYVKIVDSHSFDLFNRTWGMKKEPKLDGYPADEKYYIAMIGFSNEEDTAAAKEELSFLNLVRHNHTMSYDVNLKEINKGTGVQKAIEYLKYPYENTYCFADGMNDLQMLQSVAHPIIMANSYPDLKTFGFTETGDVLENGFYRYLVDNKLINEM